MDRRTIYALCAHFIYFVPRLRTNYTTELYLIVEDFVHSSPNINMQGHFEVSDLAACGFCMYHLL
jgi:hypothetical protein